MKLAIYCNPLLNCDWIVEYRFVAYLMTRLYASRDHSGSLSFSFQCLKMAEDRQNFYEGTEKLLEVWFTREDGNITNCDLREIPRYKWDSLLKLVRCEIVSFKRNGSLDSYVLSESSMFVSKRRFILKTCGTTTLLYAVEPLLKLVNEICKFDKVENIFYSRKNFMRPELQEKPHSSFEEEIAFLDKLFENGAAYCLGRINRDCWYLYTLDPIEEKGVTEPDQTLEILMTELDREVMKIFFRDFCSTAREATERAGIDKIIPDVIIDDKMFDPCGYSMNGLMDKDPSGWSNGHYITIHVTPEPEFSYVSFESNVPQTSYYKLITRLINIFQPGKFLMTVFANKASVAAMTHKEVQESEFSGYARRDTQFCQFRNYDLTYSHFVKFPS